MLPTGALAVQHQDMKPWPMEAPQPMALRTRCLGWQMALLHQGDLPEGATLPATTLRCCLIEVRDYGSHCTNPCKSCGPLDLLSMLAYCLLCCCSKLHLPYVRWALLEYFLYFVSHLFTHSASLVPRRSRCCRAASRLRPRKHWRPRLPADRQRLLPKSKRWLAVKAIMRVGGLKFEGGRALKSGTCVFSATSRDVVSACLQL